MDKAPIIGFYIVISSIILGEFLDNWILSLLLGIPLTALFVGFIRFLSSYVLEPLLLGWEEQRKRKRK
jgi:hypothetical protein